MRENILSIDISCDRSCHSGFGNLSDSIACVKPRKKKRKNIRYNFLRNFSPWYSRYRFDTVVARGTG